jgi:ribonuclease HI
MVVAKGCSHHRADHASGTSEEAEWLALLDAVALAREIGLHDILLLGDAAGVIGQANGTAKSRNFPHHRAVFEAEVVVFDRWRLRHIPRTQNLAGIALARLRR